VALVVGSGVHVNFDEAEIGGIKILGGPIGGNQNFGVFVVGHCFLLLLRSAWKIVCCKTKNPPASSFLAVG
jgi:hypothetical protein